MEYSDVSLNFGAPIKSMMWTKFESLTIQTLDYPIFVSQCPDGEVQTPEMG